MFNLTLSHLPTRYDLITNTPGRNQAALPLWTKLRTTLLIRIPHVVKWTFSRKLIQLLWLLSCLYLVCNWPVAVLGASEECSVKPSLPLGSYALNQWAKQTKTRERVKSYSWFFSSQALQHRKVSGRVSPSIYVPSWARCRDGHSPPLQAQAFAAGLRQGRGGLRSGPGSALLPGCSPTCQCQQRRSGHNVKSFLRRKEMSGEPPLHNACDGETTVTQCVWPPRPLFFYRKLGLHSKTPPISSLVDVPDTGWCRSFTGVRGSPTYLLCRALYGKVGGILATRSCVLPAHDERQGSMRRKRWNGIVEKEMILGTKHFFQGRRTLLLFLFMFS